MIWWELQETLCWQIQYNSFVNLHHEKFLLVAMEADKYHLDNHKLNQSLFVM